MNEFTRITGSCTYVHLAEVLHRRSDRKVHRPQYWEGRGRSFRAAIEFVCPAS